MDKGIHILSTIYGLFQYFIIIMTLYMSFCRFLPSRLAANWISDILKSHYNEPWPLWKKIPIRQRDLLFGELLVVSYN